MSMFGKRHDPSDYRVHERFDAGSMRVVIDGLECQLLDYSDGGVRISSRSPTRRVALIEIYRGEKCIRKTPAIVAWRRERQAGYAFRSNLKVFEVEGADHYNRTAREPAKEATHNATGAVAGSALRERLKL